MSDQPNKLALNVLPNSNKVEQLRAETSAPPRNLADRTVVDDALDPSLTAEQRAIRERVIDALRTVFDPELPVNIFDLGLIYSIDVNNENAVDIKMTLTAPGCPVAGTLPGEIQKKVAAVEGVRFAKVELVWNPPWDKSRISEVAMLELGLL
jgi:FeS assembly SUF system protein